MSAKIRVVIAKPGLDGHDRGAKVIARALRDAGMEVIYTGLRQTPEQIVSATLQEDADVIGMSYPVGRPHAHLPARRRVAQRKRLGDLLIVIGGIIPDVDIPSSIGWHPRRVRPRHADAECRLHQSERSARIEQ